MLIALKRLVGDSTEESCKHINEFFDQVTGGELSGQLNEDCSL